MPESAWLIPSDWELASDEWRGICLNWPNSEEWEILLFGLLFTLTRGRSWDRASGTITDAQAIGWEIFDRNHEMADCGADCPECPEPDETNPAGGALIESEEEMGQVVTDVQIVNGQIRVFFGPCCWRDLGTLEEIAAGESEGVTPPWEEIYPEGPDYSACAKATAIVDAVYDLVEAGFTQTNDAPWNWVSHIESAFGYNLDDNHTLDMMGAIMFNYLTSNMSFGDTNNSTQRQRIKSKVAALLADDGTGVPSADVFEAIKNAFAYEMTFESYAGIYFRALDAIGRTDLDSIAKMGAIANPAYDCTAVQELAPAGDVYWRGDFIQTGQTVDKAVMTVTAISDDQLSLTMKLTQEPGEEGELVGARGFAPLVVAYNIKRLVVEYTGQIPYQDWTAVPYPPPDPAQQQELGTWGFLSGGGSTTINIQENIVNKLRVEYVYANPGIPSGLGSSDNIRMPGGSQVGRPTEIEFTARIVSYNTV